MMSLYRNGISLFLSKELNHKIKNNIFSLLGVSSRSSKFYLKSCTTFFNFSKQRVYGITTATVKVGYEYSDCDLVWNIQSTKLSGHDMTSSDIDGWNLNVQHKYNYHAGILQKGDGNTVYLKYKPQV